ncbi:MAG: SDR family oxidoreductase [Phycisphaeraceae bacterium]|nr:SDR family oxidoreductase [Phycisphaeraceae bacterium]
MDISLLGKRALVCGSTQGIGRAVAIELASLGASVTLVARNPERLEQVCRELPVRRDVAEHSGKAAGGGGQVHRWFAADFAEPSAVQEAVRTELAHQSAAGPYTILVNNTGGPAGGPVAEAQPEAFVAAFRSHVVCNQLLVQALLPGMKAAGYGRIINIISTSVKAPIPGLGVSNTIRAAVANWAKTLATELAPFGITVNNVLPGFTDTDRLKQLFTARAQKEGKSLEEVTKASIATIPAGRLGRAEEVAAAVAFLATPAASYINGINVPVDGGRTQSL